MNLEHELQQALKRKSPPRGFEDRVLSRIAAGEAIQSPEPGTRWARRLLPLAASLAIAFGGSYYVWQQERNQLAQTELRRATSCWLCKSPARRCRRYSSSSGETHHESAQ